MVLNELLNINLTQLHQKLILPDEEFQQWQQEMGLLHQHHICINCNHDMRLTDCQQTGSCLWICKKRACCGIPGSKIGFKVGTFFEGTKLDIRKIIHPSYFYLHKLGTYEQTGFEVWLNTSTIVQWVQYFRDIFSEHFLANGSFWRP